MPAPRGGAWYGAEILVVDGVGVLAGVGGYLASSSWRSTARDPPTLAGSMAVGWYAVGGVGAPAVHWAHGNTAMGFASLGLRALMPPLVGITGYGASCLRDGRIKCAPDALPVGMMVGQAGATLVDVLIAREPPAPKSAERWYGWQTLAVDGAVLAGSTGLILRNRSNPENTSTLSPYLAIPLGWYAFSWVGAPIVHFAHGRVGRGFGDLGIRLLAPPLLAVAGIMGACGALVSRSGCATTGALAGIGSGMALASLFDAFVLAREPGGEQTSRATVVPLFTVTPQQTSLGLAGTFL